MVKYISDIEELKRILFKPRPDENNIVLTMSTKRAELWRKKGRFRFIRSQLENIHNLRFSCTIEENECHYIFSAPTIFLKSRILQLIHYLARDERIPIVRLKPAIIIEVPNTCTDKAASELKGTIKACPLF